MPSNTHPGFEYPLDLQAEVDAVRQHQALRGIPSRMGDNLLIASWNLCNLGHEKQKRSDDMLKIMAEILRPFDLIAVQEVRDDYRQFDQLVRFLGEDFDYMMTDRAGNDERLAFVFRTGRIARLQLAGELVLNGIKKLSLDFKVEDDANPGQLKKIRQSFGSFSRNPYLCAFQAGDFRFTLANVHIYFGKDSRNLQKDTPNGHKFRRRILETYALAWWAHDRATHATRRYRTFDTDIILMGDFNVPQMDPTDPVAKNLIKYGMQPTQYGSSQGSNLTGTKKFDQITFMPGTTGRWHTGKGGVFDYDQAVFKGIWSDATKTEAQFNKFCRYHISDHRLLWSEWHQTLPPGT